MKKLKRSFAIILAVLLMISIVPTLSTSAELYPGVVGLSRRAAAEGIVMLQNDNKVLPLDSSRSVSIFGRIQVDYFACGYGSGGDVKYPYITNLLDGMRRNPKINVNEDLARIYEGWCAKNVPNHGSWGNWPRYHAEMPLTDDVVSDAAGKSDTAVVVIGRSAGEDRESTLEKGSYYLTDLEIDMLNKVTATFDKVVIVLNVGNIIDMAWTDNYAGKIDSILYAWQGGMESGSAVADVLSGDETPSGKLAATIANTYNDYPSSENFGRSAYNNYAEDIYVGYRYFETFAEAKDKVRYGFGYGLSYTDFKIDTTRVATVGDEIQVDVKVTNTGNYKGKEVVQIYYGAPQGVLGKAAKSLVAYAKTNLLQPGASEEIKLSWKINAMASYDDAGKTANKSAWVLEAGEYPVYVGNSVRTSAKVGAYNQSALQVTEQLYEAAAVYPANNAFNRWTASQGAGDTIVLNKTGDMTPTRTIDLKAKILDEMPADLPYNQGDKGIKLLDVYQGRNTMTEFISQLTAEDLVNLTRGAGAMGHSAGIPGNASVYGGTNTRLRSFGIPNMSTTDGPSGIRMTASATLLPIGTTLACTWNDRLVEDLYAGVGKEMVLNGSDALLAPGMNLQRDPLCGRNFEYFSEDPLLTGQMGANTTRGVQSQGVSATPKHFAANNQETNRHNNDSRVSERALREIYLKGFEICVKDAKPQNIMMSYNKVNNVWAHYSYELAIVILRQQWGFDGCIMTDWWITQGSDPDFSGLVDNAYRVRSGVDVLMPGDRETQGNPLDAFNNGLLNIGEIQRCAINNLNFAMKSARFRIDNNLPMYNYSNDMSADKSFKVTQAVQGSPQVTAIYLDGQLVSNFSPQTQEYVFYRSDLTSFPNVTATAASGTSLQITQAKPGAAYATVVATLPDGGETIYRVIWSNATGLPVLDPNPLYATIDNIYINGEVILNFYKGLNSYTVWVKDPSDVTVTVDTPSYVKTSVSRTGDVFVIRAETIHQATEYVLSLDYPQPQVLPQSDDFAAGPLKDFWTVGNQNDKFSKQDGYLRIEAEGGDWYQGAGDMQKNYVWQYADGNWESVTKMTFDIFPFQNYHQLGVMVFDDHDNFIQFVLDYNNWDGNQTRPYRFAVKNEVNGSNSDSNPNRDLAETLRANTGGGAGAAWFKITKTGNVYRFYASLDGVTWSTCGSASYTRAFTQPKFGVIALKGSVSNNNITNMTATCESVEFSNVSEIAVTPPTIPVVNVAASGSSRVLCGTQYYYKTSGLGTETTSDSQQSGQNVGWTSGGEFLLYNLNVAEAGFYNVNTRIASNSGSAVQIRFSVHLDGERALTYTRSGGTGGWQSWTTISGQNLVYLKKGLNKLMFYCDTGDFNVNFLDFIRNDTPDRSALYETYTTASKLKAADYAPIEFAKFSAALAETRNILFSLDATAAGLEAAQLKLEAAMESLNTGLYTVKTGGKVTIPITVKNCDKFSGIRGEIDYDSDYLTLTSISVRNGFFGITDGNSFVIATNSGMGIDGTEIIGYAVFTAKANLLDDVTTYVSFPEEKMDVVTEYGAQGSVILPSVGIQIQGEPPLRGDVNLDGQVDLADAILLLQSLAKNATLTSRQLKAADVNGDGTINTADVIIIMQLSIA